MIGVNSLRLGGFHLMIQEDQILTNIALKLRNKIIMKYKDMLKLKVRLTTILSNLIRKNQIDCFIPSNIFNYAGNLIILF